MKKNDDSNKLEMTNSINNQSNRSSDVTSVNQNNELNTRIQEKGIVGTYMEQISDTISDNIILARYATFSAIGLLTIYGLSNTPLLFRFRNVNDIPKQYFDNRKIIHGRIVGILKPNQSFVETKNTKEEESIVCLVHHLSPIGRLLNRSAFDFFQQYNPSSMISTSRRMHDLLKIEIAGIIPPPPFVSNFPKTNESRFEWLDRLSNQKARVSCQLLTRRTPIKEDEGHSDANYYDTAIARVRYRPGWANRNEKRNSFVPALPMQQVDLASSLLQYGRANVTSPNGNPLFANQFQTSTIETRFNENNVNLHPKTMERIRSQQKDDIQYIETLVNSERHAAEYRMGLWSSESLQVHNSSYHQEILKEVVEQKEHEKRSIWKKIFFWMKSKVT